MASSETTAKWKREHPKEVKQHQKTYYRKHCHVIKISQQMGVNYAEARKLLGIEK